MHGKTPWLLLLPALLSACRRTSRCFSALPLDRAVDQLADVQLLPAPLRDPVALQALVNRLLPWLPPRRLRSCLKRSLLLMDLWSRCGLTPRLHLGWLDAAGAHDGHAWVTVGNELALSSDAEPFAGPILWESIPGKVAFNGTCR